MITTRCVAKYPAPTPSLFGTGKVLLSVLFSLLLPCVATADMHQAVSLDDNPNRLELLLPASEVLEDPSGKLTLEQVISPEYHGLFTAIPLHEKRFHRDAGVYWFRFSLRNTTSDALRFWLECDNVRLANISLYSPQGDKYLIQRSGNKLINKRWSLQERLNIMRLDLKPGENKTYYMRVEDPSRVRFALKLYTDHTHTVHLGSLSNQLGMVYGVLFALFVYTFNIYISLRDNTFLYFLGVLTAVALQTAANQGTIRILAPGNDLLVNSGSIVAALLHVLASAFFVRRFLFLPINNPTLDKMILASGLVPLLIYIALPLPLPLAERGAVFAGIASTIIIIIASAIRYGRGYAPAIFPLAGGLLLFLPMSLQTLLPENFLPALTNGNLFSLCIMLQMIILACGLGSRIDNINKELSGEISERKRRQMQLLQAQKIARYGDWSWNTITNSFSFSDSAQNILPELSTGTSNDFDKLIERASERERKAIHLAFSEATEGKNGYQAEFSLLHNNGATHYYLTQAEYQRDRRGNKTPQLIGTIHDITERKLADMAHKENEQRWRELADSTFEAILIYQENLIIDANQACDELLGYSPTQLIGTSGELFIGRESLPMLLREIEASAEGAFEFTLQRKDRPGIDAELMSKRGSFNQKKVQIVAIRDISERKQHEQQLRQLGYYDSLTGLANRTLFQQRLEHAISKSERTRQKHALLFIDLDQFKNVNDSLGHDIGDQLLIEVGKRLAERTRKVDTVARLGGDEFAILVEDIKAPYSAAKVAGELLKVMSDPIQVDDYNLQVTPSIGIALYPSNGKTGGELLRKADTAMYHAKSQGRNNYQFYTEKLNQRIIRRMALESDLRLAIPNKELSLNFQPQVDLHSGAIVGAEALLRWKSEKHGLVSPEEFITIAEETGLIWPIGELTLEDSCRQAAMWLKTYPNFGRIAVNISGIQFNHRSLVTTVKNVLQKTNLPADRLELEITEGAVINNVEDAIYIMKQLKNIGVKLSLDDFGTGFSSLNYLKRFPVDSLKIDRSFVADIASNKTDLKIADNIVKLAHDLNLNVVAEGVETQEQLNIIRNIGCDHLQGFLFSRPLNSTEYETILEEESNLYTPEPRSAIIDLSTTS